MFLYKYSCINDYYKDSLEKKYFYCSPLSKLNDPFDCHVPIKHDMRDEFIKKWINTNRSSAKQNDMLFPFYSVDDVKTAFANGCFDKYTNDLFRKKDLERFYVLSLSSKELNKVLWGTYADSYRGMCACYKAEEFVKDSKKYYGLKVKEKKFAEWRYFNKTQDGVYLNVYDVEYSNERKEYNCIASDHMLASNMYDAIDEFIWKNLRVKDLCWQAEAECRGIFHGKEPGDFCGRLYYEEEVLDSITFGYKTSEDEINLIKTIVCENYMNADKVKFFKAVPDYSTGTLKKEPL